MAIYTSFLARLGNYSVGNSPQYTNNPITSLPAIKLPGWVKVAKNIG